MATSVLTHDTAHAERAQERLAQQFRELPDMKAIAAVLAGEVQALEDAAWQVYEETLDTAVGESLNVLGRVVKLPREGASDEVYRLRIRVRVRILRSSGTIEDLVGVMLLLQPMGGTVEVVESFPAGVVCRMFGVALGLPEEVVRLLKQAKAGGVKLNLEYLGAPEAEVFTFDVGPGFEVGKLAAAY